MKTYKKLLSGFVLTFSLCLSVNSMAMVKPSLMTPQLEKDLVKICEAIQSNSRLDLKKAMKRAGVSGKSVAKKLVCNGMGAMEFARVNDADLTAHYIARYANTRQTRLAKR